MTWQQYFKRELTVCPLLFPGRETRYTEPPYEDLPSLVNALAEIIGPLTGDRYYFFGHSMGAIIAYELALVLQRLGKTLPKTLFVSGFSPPQVLSERRTIHKLEDEEFIQILFEYGGTPSEVLNNLELMQILLPTLRADFTLIETYQFIEKGKLKCPLSAFAGLSDPIVQTSSMSDWRVRTSHSFKLRFFPGNHFFIYESKELLLKAIAEDVKSSIY